jgi:hypothetical protein
VIIKLTALGRKNSDSSSDSWSQLDAFRFEDCPAKYGCFLNEPEAAVGLEKETILRLVEWKL